MREASYIYRKDHIPRSTERNRRPGTRLEASTITIHNTGNPDSTAANERGWLTNPDNTRTASFHIVVDSKEAVEAVPLNEVAWHAGDGSGEHSGNRTSIGIEICERDKTLGEYAQALSNAIDLTAKILYERGWGVDRLRRHYDWSGKNCPRLMNIDSKWTGWYRFVQRVADALKAYNKKKQVTVIVNGKELSEKGILMNSLTYVPLRVIAAALGAKIGWDQVNKEANINDIVIDGIVISGTTYVPMRLLGETIGAKVTWNQYTYTATLNK